MPHTHRPTTLGTVTFKIERNVMHFKIMPVIVFNVTNKNAN